MLDKKKLIILILGIVVLLSAFMITKNVSPDYLQNIGGSIPLPLFTLMIGIVDGFNPCNLFVLTLLVSLMLAESHSRKKILIVGFTFIGVIYTFYFLFMATWLNIFKYLGFVDVLRYGIAILAVIAGLINCKELFFYRKGVTLMIQDKYTAPLKKKLHKLAGLTKTASTPALIFSSAMLAIFASLIELPCTAGFPIIYTGILTNISQNSLFYFGYLALYNLFYVTPLLVIITILSYTFKGKEIDKTTMSYIKFVGGIIMLILGIILLFNPALLGIMG